MGGLTEKQKRFADEYLIHLNATRAYKAVYKNVKNNDVAAACASKLLRNTKVRKYVDEQLEKIHTEKSATAQEVIEYLTGVMRGNSESEIVVIEGVGEGCSEARALKKKPDERERLKAAELLGKRFGIFTEKVQVEGNVPVVISGGDVLEDC